MQQDHEVNLTVGATASFLQDARAN
jgi:hypothetical protein